MVSLVLNTPMEIAEIRRAVLQALITNRFGGVSRQLAIAAKKPERQINDMLATPARKSFGEKVARAMANELGLPAGYFDNPANAGPLLVAYPPRHEPRIKAVNEPPVDERELIEGYRAAPEEVREIMIKAARAAIAKQDFSKRSDSQ